MDSITQIALGAAVGEVVLGRRVDNKAVLWGAVAGTIPDLDVIPGQFLSTLEQLEFHRGVSHSIVFSVVMAPILGYLVYRLYKGRSASWRAWALLFFWGLITHPILDCFTTWGTQFFWPLDYRVAFKSVSVVDPLYTMPIIITTIWLMFKSRSGRGRRVLNIIGLSLSSFYLLITVVNKAVVHQTFEDALLEQNISYNRFDTRPTLLNNMLWTANVETDSGYYLGYYSLLDSNGQVDFRYFPQNDSLLDDLRDNPKIQRLLKITQGWYTVQEQDDVLEINDLRFGQTFIWPEANNQFVFSYIVKQESGQVTIDQKDIDYGGDVNTFLNQLWYRLRGNQTARP